METKKENETFYYFSILCMGLAIGFFITMLIVTFNVGGILDANGLMYEKDCITNIDSTLNDTLWTIENNCGSTFITHQYNSNDWFVFTKDCNDDGYCKNVYWELKDCLKEN